MRLLEKLRTYAWLAPRAHRNRGDLLRHLARRPAIGIGIATYEAGLVLSSRVDNRTKTLAAIKTASMVGCAFCLDLGSAMSTRLSVTERDLHELAHYQTSPSFNNREKLAIELAETMTACPAAVSDDLQARLVGEFTKAEVVELAAEIAWENHRSRLNRALGVRSMGFSDDGFCLRPDHHAP